MYIIRTYPEYNQIYLITSMSPSITLICTSLTKHICVWHEYSAGSIDFVTEMFNHIDAISLAKDCKIIQGNAPFGYIFIVVNEGDINESIGA